MVEDPLRDVIDTARSRLQGELETQLRAVSERHQQLLGAAREHIQADADQQWSARLEAVKSESERELQAALSAARAEMESLSHHADLLRSARPATSERESAASRVVRGLRGIEGASSVSDSLEAIVRAAAAEVPRAALFLANGTHLDEWAVSGIPSLSDGSLKTSDPNHGMVVEALTRGEVIRNGSASAVPLLLDGAAIGVLYGEADAESTTDGVWPDCLETVARYGAGRLGYLTALRTAQARQWLATQASAVRNAAGPAREPDGRWGAGNPTGAAQDETAVAAARRYARLVVSEVKLYNAAAVETGRDRRDLGRRLGPEIERARRLYEERVPASVAGRADYFQQELVQTLAGGDSSLLG